MVYSPHWTRCCRITWFVTILVLLPGCGFKLRGAVEVPDSLQTLYIAGVDEYSAFATELRTALRGSGVSIVDEPGQAQAVLRIYNLQRNWRVLTVSGVTGRVNEFELFYNVTYDVQNVAGESIVPKQSVSLLRDLTFDERDVLGKANEQAVVEREAMRDAVQQILRQLRVQVQATGMHPPTVGGTA